ncbi:hypothetical protein PLESTB_001627200 [Pleodorina starrii]|uniref:RING-type domain-containing protein n=1 Tax=Pleodorina starrii TaxID=330485 RepID=A0A9W6BYG3_9CHLO|nr:hypothetical protein PLESTB_001627200 [Pleodorina starrii]GLC77143.1 hypothetical protein PLESTF_001890900 [Pleodorina starrii]
MAFAAALLRIAFMAVASFTIGWLAGKVYEATSAAASEEQWVHVGGGGGECGFEDDDRRRGGGGAACRRGSREAAAAAAAAAAGGRRRSGGGAGGLDGLCAVCMDAVATMGFQHGRRVHCCLCGGCWRELRLRGRGWRCPLCNQEGLCVEVIPT